MTRSLPALPPGVRYSAATPTSTGGIAAWQRALTASRRAAEAELSDVARLISIWYAEHPNVPVSTDDLTRIALRENLLPHTLRRSPFRTRCSRLAELLGRVALAQGKEGIEGLRIARDDIERRARSWIVRRAEDADRAIEDRRRKDVDDERRRDAAVAEKRRKAAIGSAPRGEIRKDRT